MTLQEYYKARGEAYRRADWATVAKIDKDIARRGLTREFIEFSLDLDPTAEGLR